MIQKEDDFKLSCIMSTKCVYIILHFEVDIAEIDLEMQVHNVSSCIMVNRWVTESHTNLHLLTGITAQTPFFLVWYSFHIKGRQSRG